MDIDAEEIFDTESGKTIKSLEDATEEEIIKILEGNKSEYNQKTTD
jgi:hypothetical protein